MYDVENDSSTSFCEEPIISYYSSSLNCGVSAIFSHRNQKPYKQYNMSFTPSSIHNNNFSLYNTIMLPFITRETSIEVDKNNNRNIINQNNISSLSQKERIQSLKADNSRNKTDSFQEEKNNNSEEKQSNNILIDKNERNSSLNVKNNNDIKKNIFLEENPFFLGKTFSSNNQQSNKKPKKNSIIYSDNINNDNIKKNKSQGEVLRKSKRNSVIYGISSKRKNIIIKDDDKSENILKKSKKIKMKNAFLNIRPVYRTQKTQKVSKEKNFKRKITFNMDSKHYKKNMEKENDDKDKDKEKDKDKDKDDNSKKKKERRKNKSRTDLRLKHNVQVVEKRRKSHYHSNKCIYNYYDNFNSESKKNKLDDNQSEDEKSEKKVIKKNNSKVNIKRKENKNSKGKETKEVKEGKEEHKKSNSKKMTKNKTYHQYKGLDTLKEYIKLKEKDEKDDKDEDSSKERSWNIEKEKKVEFKNKKYNSRSDIKRVKLKRKDSDSEDKKKDKRFKRGKTFIKESKKDKNSEDKEEKNTTKETKVKKDSNKQIVKQEKENDKEKEKEKDKINDSENNNKINKCLTIDLNRKKNSTMFDKSIKLTKFSNTTKKKPFQTSSIVLNLFGNDMKLKKAKKNIDFEFALKNNLKKMQFNLFSKDKFTNTEFSDSDYLKYTLDCMELILDIDMEKQTRLKNKINFNFPKPKKNKTKKKIALFDLDETLVHCTGDVKNQKEKYQYKIEIKLPGKQAVEVGINLRPYWKQTLNLIKKNYYIVIYTASHQAYADSVLDFMDPKKKYFKYRLYRNNCSLIDVDGSKFYVKDLDIFNEYYDLKDIVIIDNSVLSFAYHLHNGIPIVPYYDEDKDGSLYVVGLYLIHIFNEDDLREANKKQINLDSFMEEAKKNKEEEEYIDDNQIDEESDSKEDDNNDNNENNDNNKENNDNNNDKNNNNINNNIKKDDIEKKFSKKSLESMTEKDKKKFSEKKIFFVVKKKSSNLSTVDNHRDQNNDFNQRKLMSQSKLINLYYEVKDKSPKNENIIEPRKSKLNSENNLNDKNLINNDKSTIIVDNHEDLDCKSEPGYLPNDQNNLSDIDSSNEDKFEPFIKRVFTMVEDMPINHNKSNDIHKEASKNSSRAKLGFIRSNFYNNFKI